MNRRFLAVELVALGGLCALVGFATVRLVEGWWEPAIALAASSLGVGVAVILERLVRPRLSGILAALVRLTTLVVGGAMVAFGTTGAALQNGTATGSPGWLSATSDALLHGWSSIVTAPVPSAASPRMLVPIAVASWGAAACAAMLALRPERPAATHSASALLPCLAVLAAACLAAGAAQPSGVFVGGLALVASGVALVARTAARRAPADSDDQLPSRWAHLGAALVAVALMGGVVAGPALALGRDVDPFDPRDRLDPPVVDAAAINPLDIVALARQQPDTVLFTVRSTASVPIRIASLDQFDGARWTSSGEFERASVTFDQPDIALPNRAATAEFWLADLTSPWLPTIDLPDSLRGADVLVDTASFSFVAPIDAPPDLNYTVTARLPRLDVAVLRNGLPVARDASALQAAQLPATLPLRLRELADGITAGAPSAFDEALLINAHLASTLRVDAERPGGHSFGHLTEVLFESGVANEEQLATAFALLARSVELPTRVTVGVDPAVVNDAGTFDITGADLRVWPEVRFDDFGWVAFRLDVDRLDDNGEILVGLDDTTTAVPPRVFDTDDAPTLAATPELPNPAPVAPTRVSDVEASTSPSTTPAAFDPAEGLGRLVIAALAGALLAALIAVAIVVAKRMRTARRRALGDPRAAVIGAWDDVLERLREAEPTAHSPHVHTVEQIIETNRSSGSAITAMYRPVTRALYDDRPMSKADADQVWQARDRFVSSVNEHTTLRCRVRRAVDPRPLRSDNRTADRATPLGTDTGGVS